MSYNLVIEPTFCCTQKLQYTTFFTDESFFRLATTGCSGSYGSYSCLDSAQSACLEAVGTPGCQGVRDGDCQGTEFKLCPAAGELFVDPDACNYRLQTGILMS